MDERQQNTSMAIREAGVDWAILTSPDAVAYAAGHVVPIEAGSSPFAGGPTTAIVSREGLCGLLAANVEAAAARDSFAETVSLYEGFAWDHPVDLVQNFLQGFEKLAYELGVGGRIGIEPDSFPYSLALALPDASFVSVMPALAKARAVKTAAERQALLTSAGIASIGQKALAQAVRAGRTELEVFADIRCAMEDAAGQRLPVTGDFLSGTDRTAGASGWPISRVIEGGDPLICDLAPRVAGYWGDSCASAALGAARPEYIGLFEAAKTALLLAVDVMRPGLVVADLDRRLREQVAGSGYAFPHHSGHSIGTAVHEWPRIVPYEQSVLSQGMVLMVEPGAYHPDIGGVRTEWMIEVTNDGCRVLTDFEHVPTL